MSVQNSIWERMLESAEVVAASTRQSEHPTYPHVVACFRMGVAQTVLSRESAICSFAYFTQNAEQLLNEQTIGGYQRSRLLLMRSLTAWINNIDPTLDDIYAVADEAIEALSQGVNRSVVPTLLFLLSRCYVEVRDRERLLQMRKIYPDLWTGLPDTIEKRVIDQAVLDLQTDGAVSISWCTNARTMIVQTLHSDDSETLPLDSMLHYLRIIAYTSTSTHSGACLLREFA